MGTPFDTVMFVPLRTFYRYMYFTSDVQYFSRSHTHEMNTWAGDRRTSRLSVVENDARPPPTRDARQEAIAVGSVCTRDVGSISIGNVEVARYVRSGRGKGDSHFRDVDLGAAKSHGPCLVVRSEGESRTQRCDAP